MECDSKDTIEQIVEPVGPVVMKHRGRPTRSNDDGTVNTKPVDPDYFFKKAFSKITRCEFNLFKLWYFSS